MLGPDGQRIVEAVHPDCDGAVIVDVGNFALQRDGVAFCEFLGPPAAILAASKHWRDRSSQWSFSAAFDFPSASSRRMLPLPPGGSAEQPEQLLAHPHEWKEPPGGPDQSRAAFLCAGRELSEGVRGRIRAAGSAPWPCSNERPGLCPQETLSGCTAGRAILERRGQQVESRFNARNAQPPQFDLRQRRPAEAGLKPARRWRKFSTDFLTPPTVGAGADVWCRHLRCSAGVSAAQLKPPLRLVANDAGRSNSRFPLWRHLAAASDRRLVLAPHLAANCNDIVQPRLGLPTSTLTPLYLSACIMP